MVHSTLKVKWGKEEFDLPVDISAGVLGLKEAIYQRTGVPHDKQRLLGLPGGALRDSDDLQTKISKEGMKVTLLGTAEAAQLKEPVEKTVFVEDLSADEIARVLKIRKKEVLPVGLENLGNTCYMNSVVQALLSLPEFRNAIGRTEMKRSPSTNPSDLLLSTQFRALASTMGNVGNAVSPFLFVTALRQRFPEFGQMDSHGHHAQQDAEECFRGLLQSLSATLPSLSTGSAEEGANAIDDLFGFNMRSSWKCAECPEEPETAMSEEMRILLCHMGTATEPVSHLHEGIKLSLKESVTKDSMVLRRPASFEKVSGMAQLPPFLVVQFARFTWKSKSDSAGTAATKTKVTRRVAFQSVLDVFDFSTSDVQATLTRGRQRKMELRIAKDEGKAEEPAGPLIPTGTYQLQAIVSHQGRSADGGHYVAWTRRAEQPAEVTAVADPTTTKELGKPKAKSDGSDDLWLKFDDETVHETNWKYMMEQGGIMGGLADSQIAYFCIFSREMVPEKL